MILNYSRKLGLTTALGIRIQRNGLNLVQHTGRGAEPFHLQSILRQLGEMTPLRVNTDSSLHWYSTRGATAAEGADTSEKGDGDVYCFKTHQMILVNIPFAPSPSPLPALSPKSRRERCETHPCWDCGLEEHLGREVGKQVRSMFWKAMRSDMGFGLEVGGEPWRVFK